MTEARCPVCAAAQRDTLVCRPCWQHLGDCLRLALPGPAWDGFEAELLTSLTRQGKSAPNLGGGRSSERPLPFDNGASMAGDALRYVLADWVRRLMVDLCTCRAPFEPCVQLWPADNLHALACWLGRPRRLDTARYRLDAADMHRDIVGAVERVLRIVGQPPARQLVGRCGICEGGQLFAKLDEDTGTCDRCARVIVGVKAKRAAMLAEVDHALLTQREVRELLADRGVRISGQRFANWLRRQRLSPVTVDRLARPLYRVSEVEALATRSDTQAASV